jgi:hypothetical protein
MMIASAPASTSGFRLLVESVADLLFCKVAERFHQPAEGADVADDVALRGRLRSNAWRTIFTAAWLISTTRPALPWRLSMIRLPPNVLVRMQSLPACA